MQAQSSSINIGIVSQKKDNFCWYEVHLMETNKSLKRVKPAMAILQNRQERPSWGIDAMLIDEELLYLDEKEADRMYYALKEKTTLRRNMEARESRLSTKMAIAEYASQKSLPPEQASKQLNELLPMTKNAMKFFSKSKKAAKEVV